MKRLILVFIILLVTPLVLADYPTMNPPHIFEGSVTVNGAPAPDDILVSARMEDDLEKDIASTTTINGKYRLKIGDPYGDRSGEIVHFFINGHDTGQTITWETSSSITTIDLNIDGINLGGNDNSGDGDSSDGGSSSSGGGGGGAPKTINENKEKCIPNWICSSWGDCISGVQNRVCVDQNRCNTEEGKPEESRGCEVPEELKATGNEETKQNFFKRFLNMITGAAIGNKSTAKGVTITALIVIVGIVVFLFMARGKNKEKASKKTKKK